MLDLLGLALGYLRVLDYCTRTIHRAVSVTTAGIRVMLYPICELSTYCISHVRWRVMIHYNPKIC